MRHHQLFIIWVLGAAVVGILWGAARKGHPFQTQSLTATSVQVISRNCPVYASATDYPPTNANDDSYNTTWRSIRTPSAQAPAWIAYNLSTAHPRQVIVVWYNNPTYGYDFVRQGGPAYSLPRDYTLEINKAPGGHLPLSGWETRVTVVNNVYHSRMHLLNMAGYHWLRLRCTATQGTNQNYDVNLQMDVHDASHGTGDTWLFLGDSITAGGMVLSDPAFGQIVNAQDRKRYPCQENGGIGGATTGSALQGIDQWLRVFPGHYVTLSYGTNDVNTTPGNQQAIRTAAINLTTLAQKVLAAGKTPIIPHIPWAPTPGIEANGPLLNQQIDQLIAKDHRVLAGPDLFQFYKSHPSLISADHLHPSTPAGFQAYREVWAKWALHHR